jgi:hypothetical protein
MNSGVWIVSSLKAYATTFFAGLFAGFGLGVHAVRADIGPWIFGAIAFVALAGLWRDGRWRGARAEASSLPPSPARRTPRAALVAHPSSAAEDDAQAALVSLGYSAHEARNAVAGAVAALDGDADASAIVRTALRGRNR